MKNNYQMTMNFYYKDDRSKVLVKTTSYKSVENAIKVLENIIAKRYGDNTDNWTIIKAQIVNKETSEIIFDREYM